MLLQLLRALIARCMCFAGWKSALRYLRPAVLVLSTSLVSHAASAADTSQPTNVITLTASATVEVPSDTMLVTMRVTREGKTPSAVQAALSQALDAALVEAKRAAKPGDMEVRTGGFSVHPRYQPNNVISGWQGSADLLIQGRDIKGISELVARLPTMTVAGSDFLLSRQQRQKVEAEVAADAVAAFRAKADTYTKLFGFSSYTIRAVRINSNEPHHPRPVGTMMGASMAATRAEALPVEPGKEQVTVSVDGSVQMR